MGPGNWRVQSARFSKELDVFWSLETQTWLARIYLSRLFSFFFGTNDGPGMASPPAFASLRHPSSHNKVSDIMRRALQCRWMDLLVTFLRRNRRCRTSSSSNADSATMLTPSSNGKRRADQPTWHRLAFKRGMDWSGPAPRFVPLGTTTCSCQDGLRVLSVKTASPAARCGLKPFDLILQLSVKDPVETSSQLREVPLGDGRSLAELVEFVKEGRLHVERPPVEAWPALYDRLRRASAPPGVSDPWVHAVLGCAAGDAAVALACVHQLLHQGYGRAEILARRVSALEATFVGLASRVDLANRGALDENGAADLAAEVEGALLVELALDRSHHEMAQHLLSLQSSEGEDRLPRITLETESASRASVSMSAAASGSSHSQPASRATSFCEI